MKHYAANNIERNRETDIAQMDEQTLQEVYAHHFGMIVKDHLESKILDQISDSMCGIDQPFPGISIQAARFVLLTRKQTRVSVINQHKKFCV